MVRMLAASDSPLGWIQIFLPCPALPPAAELPATDPPAPPCADTVLPLLLRRDAGCLAIPVNLRVLMNPSRLCTAKGSAARLALLPAAAVGVLPLLPLLPCSLKAAAAAAVVAEEGPEDEGP